MWKRGVVLVGAIVLTAHLAACTSATSESATSDSVTPSAAPPSPAQSVCPPSGARVFAGGSDAAMGERTLDLNVVNCGSEPFTLDKYPTIRVLDDKRQAFDVKITDQPTVVNDGRTAKPRTVVLQPGKGALTILDWHDIVTYGTTVNGTYLEVVLRKGDEPQLVEPKYSIDLGTTGALTVTPWNG
jgi:hypothetical protein